MHTVFGSRVVLLADNGEGNAKVIRNPYPGPKHHQKLISSSNR